MFLILWDATDKTAKANYESRLENIYLSSDSSQKCKIMDVAEYDEVLDDFLNF